jgi:hypothetical protein
MVKKSSEGIVLYTIKSTIPTENNITHNAFIIDILEINKLWKINIGKNKKVITLAFIPVNARNEAFVIIKNIRKTDERRRILNGDLYDWFNQMI